MRAFDYSFLCDENTPAAPRARLREIADMKAVIDARASSRAEAFSRLADEALLRAAESSCAIEGIVAENGRARAVAQKLCEPENIIEAQIAGYADALRAIDARVKQLDFTEYDILDLHEIMTLPMGLGLGGRYKRYDNVIVGVGADGKAGVRRRTVSKRDTAQAMECLTLAYKSAREDARAKPLFYIPCVIFDFLSIHPFEDGNGRMSRLLTRLLCLKNGLDACKYMSLEERIYADAPAYYRALQLSSEGWETNENTVWPFVEHFLTVLSDCYRALVQCTA